MPLRSCSTPRRSPWGSGESCGSATCEQSVRSGDPFLSRLACGQTLCPRHSSCTPHHTLLHCIKTGIPRTSLRVIAKGSLRIEIARGQGLLWTEEIVGLALTCRVPPAPDDDHEVCMAFLLCCSPLPREFHMSSPRAAAVGGVALSEGIHSATMPPPLCDFCSL